MKITVLIDNTTLQENLVAEKGFSAFIEEKGKNILYDAGKEGNVVHNADELGIDLLSVDIVAFSHGHHDHVNGLKSFINLLEEKNDTRKRKLIIHPKGFIDRWSSKDDRYIGSMLKEQELAKYFDIQYSKNPVALSDKLFWLGEIERTNDFECKNLETHTNLGKDKIEDDTALVYKSEKGLVIIAGCSHSGICNIIEYSKKRCGDQKIADVIGGIHLKNAEVDFIEKTISELSKTKLAELHFCHCTGEKAYSYLNEQKENLKFFPIGCGWSREYL